MTIPLGPHVSMDRFVTSEQYGRSRRLAIRPGRYRHRRLAAQLGDAFQDIGRDNPRSVSELCTAIRSFLRHMDAQMAAVEASSTFELRDLRLRHIDGWEMSRLADQRNHPTDTAYRYVTQLFSLLRRINQDQPGLLHPDISLRLTRNVRLSHIRRPGDADHPPDEVRRIRSAAHRVVRRHLEPAGGGTPNAWRHLLFAFHVLLSLSTGEPPEVIRGIRMADITATPITGHRVRSKHSTLSHADLLSHLATQDVVQLYAVTLTKRRSGMTYDVVYDRTQHKQAFRALNDLLTATASFRHLASDDTLWIRPVGDRAVIHYWADQRLTLEGWYETHVQGRSIEGPFKFARLRKTAIARQAADDPTRYLRDGRNHTTRTFFGHYTNSAVLRAKSGRLVVDTIHGFFDGAIAGPTVVTPEAEELLRNNRGETDQITDSTAHDLFNGVLEGGLTACRDPEDSPFADPGHICPVARSGRCFACPNAIITKEHLPQLIAYERISDPSSAADPTVWNQVWRETHEAIGAVLPLFPVEMVLAARVEARDVLSDFGVENGPRGMHE